MPMKTKPFKSQLARGEAKQFKAITPLGLDISGRWVKAVQIARGPHHTLRLDAAARFARVNADAPVGPDEGAWILSVLERAGFTVREVAVVAPVSSVISGNFELPPRGSGAPIEKLARLELARVGGTQPELLECGMWDIPRMSPRPNDPTRVMAVGLLRDRAEELVGGFRDPAIDVTAIEVRGLANARACDSIFTGQALNCVVDVGWDSAVVGVYVSDPMTGRVTLMLERTLKEGGLKLLYSTFRERYEIPDLAIDFAFNLSTLTEATDECDALNQAALIDTSKHWLMDLYDTLGAEVERSMNYAAGRYPKLAMGRVIVTGDGGQLPGIVEGMTERLGLEVVPASIARRVTVPPDLARFAVCTGLTGALGAALRSADRSAILPNTAPSTAAPAA